MGLLGIAGSTFGGSLLGMLTALLVNVALVELTISSLFAIYFIIVSICSCGWIIHRIVQGNSADPDENHQKQLLFFAGLVGVSSLSALLLRGWLIRQPTPLRIIVYGLLGISVAFSLIFSVVDFINVLWGFVSMSTPLRPIVQSVDQVRFIIFLSSVMGLIYGTLFGLLKADEDLALHVQMTLARQNMYCLPSGAVIGALGGLGNQILRSRNRQRIWTQIPEIFTEEI